MPEIASVTFDEHDGVVVARLRGEIDLSNADQLGERLQDGVRNSALGMVLDLTDVRYLDSAGLRLLFDLGTRLRWRGLGSGVVVTALSAADRVLRLTDASSVIPIFANVSEAVDRLRGAAG